MTTLTNLLEPLIGQRFTVANREGIVIEVMDDPPTLILQGDSSHGAIQTDHLGRPQSMTHSTWAQSLYGTSGSTLHPDLQRQIEPELARAIHERLTQNS